MNVVNDVTNYVGVLAGSSVVAKQAYTNVAIVDIVEEEPHVLRAVEGVRARSLGRTARSMVMDSILRKDNIGGMFDGTAGLFVVVRMVLAVVHMVDLVVTALLCLDLHGIAARIRDFVISDPEVINAAVHGDAMGILVGRCIDVPDVMNVAVVNNDV